MKGSEEYDWIDDPFDEKKIAEERERYGSMSGTSKALVGVGCLLFAIGFAVLVGLLLVGIM